jgi:hypothetical protein
MLDPLFSGPADSISRKWVRILSILGCFGKDLAAWLRDKLRQQASTLANRIRRIGAGDSGSRTAVNHITSGQAGNADGSSDNRDEGEWRVIVEKKQSIGWRFSGQGTITGDDGLLLSVKEILMADPSIRHVHVADV